MGRPEFEAMVRRMTTEVPADAFDGVTEVVVSPRAVPHPTRDGIFTLGECIPLPLEQSGVDAVQSRIVLYHGSFLALAELDPEFDWEEEAWETLTHELRHHLEWRANRDALEAFDRAAEQNFARHDDEPFDALFFLDGEAAAPGVHQVDDDWFLDHPVRRRPTEVTFGWHGRRYRVVLPAEATLPAYLLVEGVHAAPPGDLVVVVRHPPRLLDLFRRRPPPWQGRAAAHPIRSEES